MSKNTESPAFIITAAIILYLIFRGLLWVNDTYWLPDAKAEQGLG